MVAAIILNPTHAKVGSSVLITGSAFNPGDTMSFTYGGSPIVPTEAPIVVAGDGTLPTCHIVIPNGVQGIHAVVATDASLNTASANFTVDPDIALTPSTQRIGGAIEVHGHGFAGASLITLLVGGVDKTPVTHITDANGEFDFTGIIVPTLTSGAQTVSATDAATNNATATLTVSAPTLARSPTHGPKGTVVTLTGANYIPSHALTITNIDGTTSSATADSSGNIPAGTTISSGPNVQGSHNITVSDGTNTGTVAFTTDTSLSVAPTSGKVGDTITITGEGYANASAVSSTFAGSAVTTTPPAPSPSAAGHFTATFPIPDAVHGANTVECTDAAMNVADATVTVQASASIDPSEGPAGELLTITGDGFAGASAIILTLDGVTVPAVSPITSGADGDVSGTLQLSQSLAKGDHTLVITDASANSVTLTYTVNEDLQIQVTVHNPSNKFSQMPVGVIDEEGIPVANASYVTVGIIDMFNFIRATLELYDAHSSTDLTFQILGMIDDGSDTIPDVTSKKWLPITAYTDVAVTKQTGKLVEITTRYSWLRIDVKAASDSTLDIYGRLHAF